MSDFALNGSDWPQRDFSRSDFSSFWLNWTNNSNGKYMFLQVDIQGSVKRNNRGMWETVNPVTQQTVVFSVQ